mgnify:CR=1 FL=1
MQCKSFNQLILMTDEHTRKVLGCYGNKIVKTPHIDCLARTGTLFENAYTNVPICVPARASFASDGREETRVNSSALAFSRY